MRVFGRLVMVWGTWMLAGVPAPAQFVNLSTTDDGGTIYFSTRLRPAGSRDSGRPKVYRLDGSGFQLAGQSAPGVYGSLETGGWMVESASVSGDGSVVAVNSRIQCRFGSPCLGVLQEFAEIRTLLGTGRYSGIAEVGRKGRYVLLRRETGFGPFPSEELAKQRGVNLLDLQTGARIPLGSAPAQTGRWLSEDGTALVQRTGWQLVNPSGVARNFGPVPGDVYRAVLAPDAEFVVYQEKSGPSALRVRAGSGAETLLSELGSSPSISSDARQILYLAPVDGTRQAFLVSGAGRARQVTFEPDGLQEAVLSGTAGLVVAVTGAGQLITVDARNGNRTEHISRSPVPGPFSQDLFVQDQPVYPGVAPGSRYVLQGRRLAGERLRVLVNGQEGAILSVSPEEISYQVAWETPAVAPGNGAELALRAEDSTFELVLDLQSVEEVLPAFVPIGTEPNPIRPEYPPRMLFAVHGDWRGLVSSADPAARGEAVHLYATGLGPVFPRVATGEPGPVSPLATVPLDCAWQTGPDQIPAEILYAGLAPGVIGFYQVTVRVPAVPEQMGLYCVNGRAAIGFPVE